MTVEQALDLADEIMALENRYDVAKLLLKIENDGALRGVDDMSRKLSEL